MGAQSRAPRFEHVVVGVDGSEASLDACRQAAWVAPASAAIEVVSVVHLADAVRVGFRAPAVEDELRREAEAALAAAVAALAELGRNATPVFVNGFVADALLHRVDAVGADLLVVGSHGRSRLEEILIGGVAGDVLHRARGSVLVTRPRDAAPGRAVVLGDDDTPPARLAAEVAAALAGRLGLPLHAVTAADHPVQALVDSVGPSDLLVLGSRHLTGVRALGSVSERVAHQAPCSVLVVRSGAV